MDRTSSQALASVRGVRRNVAAMAMEAPVSTKAKATVAGRVQDWRGKRLKRETWQVEAYEHVNSIGELGYVLLVNANTVAKGRLAVVQEDDDGIPVDPPRNAEGMPIFSGDRAKAERVLRFLRGPEGDQAAMLFSTSLHDQVAGEALLMGEVAETGSALSWEVVSILEIVQDARKRNADGSPTLIRKRTASSTSSIAVAVGEQTDTPLDPNTYLARYHRRDLAYSGDATSALRRNATVCREIILLDQLKAVMIKSRLSAGILFTPEEVDFPIPEDQPVEDIDGASVFLETIMDFISAAVEDRTSANSLAPLIVQVPSEFIAHFRLMGLADETMTLDTVKAARDDALDRLAAGLDVPQERMTGLGQTNHWCVDPETLAYTRHGWRPHTDLAVGDEIWTVNHDTGQGEWAEIEDFYRADVIDEPMVSMANRSHDSLTTPNHRWPTISQMGKRTWRTTETAVDSDRVLTTAPAVDTAPKYDDEIVRLVAWYSAEGTLTKRTTSDGVKPGQIRIGQSHVANPDDTAEIRRVLTAVFGPGYEPGNPPPRYGPPSWTESFEPHRGMTLFVLNAAARDVMLDLVPGYDKIVPAGFIDDLTATQAELFVRTFMQADGAKRDQVITQVVAERVDAIERACSRAGLAYRRSVATRPEGAGFSTTTQHRISLRRARSTAAFVTRTEVTYTGTIWCPVTRNGSWFASRNGTAYYTGNSGALLSADEIQRHVIPLGERLARFFTTAYFRKMLIEFEDMDEVAAERFYLAYEAPETRMDKAASADSLYEDGSISTDARIEAHGFDPELHRPSEEERTWTILTELATMATAANKPLIAAMLAIADIDIDDELLEKLLHVPAPAVPGQPTDEDDDEDDDEDEAEEPPGENDETPGGPDQPDEAEELAIYERLRTAGSLAVDRALEKATARVFTNRTKLPEGTKTELGLAKYRDRRRRADVLRALGPADWLALNTSPEALVRDEFAEFELQATAWLRDLFRHHHDSATGDELARMSAGRLVAELDRLALSAFARPLRRHQGLVVPMSLIRDNLVVAVGRGSITVAVA